MGQMTEDEVRAIAEWTASNKPKRFLTGHSAIFDEFGNKRAGLKFRLAALSKRIRRVRGYTSMTYVQIAHQLAVNADEVMAACVKHNIPTADR